MINLGIAAARVVAVGCVAFIGYSFGRIHGFNHATQVHSDNLFETTSSVVLGWLVQAKDELAEMESRLSSEIEESAEFQTLSEAIAKEKEYIASLELFLQRPF